MQKDESSANEKQEEGRKRPLALASTSKRMKTEDEEEEFHLDVMKSSFRIIFNIVIIN